jgi:hypothetical protein
MLQPAADAAPLSGRHSSLCSSAGCFRPGGGAPTRVRSVLCTGRVGEASRRRAPTRVGSVRHRNGRAERMPGIRWQGIDWSQQRDDRAARHDEPEG